MSNYGPPGGPNPGQPDQQYGQPTDPWGGQDSWGGGQVSTPPGAPGSPGAPSAPGYADYGDPTRQGGSGTQRFDQPYPPQQLGPQGQPQPVWTQAAPMPPRKRSSAPLIALVVVLALLVFGGGGFALWTLAGGDEKPDASPSASTDPSAGAEPTDGASPEPETSAAPDPTSAQPGATSGVSQVKTGQCVKNETVGDGKPQLAITTCAAGTYQVLARFDGATTGEADAQAKCKDVTGYTDWYFYNSSLDDLDFVLCMKKR